MKKITVLGSGMVGRVIAIDLSDTYHVTCVDGDQAALGSLEEIETIKTQSLDFSDKKELQKVIADADLVIGAVPGFLGFETMRTVIESGKNNGKWTKIGI